MTLLKWVALAVSIGAIGTPAAQAAFLKAAPASVVPIRVDWRTDWQRPEQLPRRFRNHCSYDRVSGRPYCSDHCGIDYQFYACTTESFGCCHVGHGYCDWNGLLRCHP